VLTVLLQAAQLAGAGLAETLGGGLAGLHLGHCSDPLLSTRGVWML